jgi:hypothetical protein
MRLVTEIFSTKLDLLILIQIRIIWSRLTHLGRKIRLIGEGSPEVSIMVLLSNGVAL